MARVVNIKLGLMTFYNLIIITIIIIIITIIITIIIMLVKNFSSVSLIFLNLQLYHAPPE